MSHRQPFEEVKFGAVPASIGEFTSPEIRWRGSLEQAHKDCAWWASRLGIEVVRVYSRTIKESETVPEYKYLGNQDNLPRRIRDAAGH